MSAEDDELDGLRRRLYAPGVSQDDLTRYAAATAPPDTASAPAAAKMSADPEPPTPRRRRRTLLAGVAGAVAVVVAITVGTVAGRPSVRATFSATPSASSPAMDEAELPAPASMRAGLVARLDGGEHADLLDLLEADPGLLPPQLRTVSRADSIEYSGEGTKTITLSPSALAERGGRATVIIVLARADRYLWRASRSAARTAPAMEEQVVATRTGTAGAGAPVAATFAYGRGAPSRLTVVVAAGTRWGAVVVFTD